VVVSAAGFTGAAGASPQAHVSVSSWTIATNPLGTSLSAVSCAGSSFCAAVGPLNFDNGALSGLAVWNGGGWSASVDPAHLLDRAELVSISCVSDAFCMAVGQFVNDVTGSNATLVEQWNGSSWSVVSSPDGSGAESGLAAVSCASASFCLAVGASTAPGGGDTTTLSELWNGSTWTVVPDPAGGANLNLTTLSCTSPTFCLSLGLAPGAGPFGVAPAQLLWNGATWTLSNVTAAPPPVAGLSCTSPTFCMAAAGNTFMTWNGDGSWSPLAVTPSSDDDAIASVACTSPTFCLAVGSRDGHQTSYLAQTLVKEWNGTSWVYSPSSDANTDANDQLVGVSCTSATCVAVGTADDPLNGDPAGLIETSPLAAASQGPSGPATAPIVGMATTPDGNGYWLVGSDGAVDAYGDAVSYGSMQGTHLNAPIVGMATTPDGGGYWLVATDGGIFAFGDARFFGSTGAIHLNQPIVGMTPSPDGLGYWFVASDGGIFAFGDATFWGSMGATHLNEPVVGMAVDNFTGGYWLVASDGGVFAFHAPFDGSTGALHLNKPIVGMEADPGGGGYRFVASDGGVFSFNLPFSGSTGAVHLNQPMVGMAAFGPGGYWLVARDGGIFAFGGAPFEGSPA
jgi:hypothetical protein